MSTFYFAYVKKMIAQVPQNWQESIVNNPTGPYDGCSIYTDPDTRKIHKAPLSPSALHFIQIYGFLEDYNKMAEMIGKLGLFPNDDYEAFIAGQLLSVNTITNNQNQTNEIIKHQVDALANNHSAMFFKQQMEIAQRALEEEKNKWANAANHPAVIQELNNEKNERARLLTENNDLRNQVNELQSENATLKAEIEKWKKFEHDVKAGTVGHYYDEYNQLSEQLKREYEGQINTNNIEHAKTVNDMNEQIYKLDKEINELKLKVEKLQQESKMKMDKLVFETKLEHVENASTMVELRTSLLQFIYNILGVFDDTDIALKEIVLTINKAHTDVNRLTNMAIDINGMFKDVHLPDFKAARETVENMKKLVHDAFASDVTIYKKFLMEDKLPDKLPEFKHKLPDLKKYGIDEETTEDTKDKKE